MPYLPIIIQLKRGRIPERLNTKLASELVQTVVTGGREPRVCLVYLGVKCVFLGEVCLLEVCHFAWFDVEQAVLISSHRNGGGEEVVCDEGIVKVEGVVWEGAEREGWFLAVLLLLELGLCVCVCVCVCMCVCVCVHMNILTWSKQPKYTITQCNQV